MNQQKEPKNCLFCDKPVKGRSDKKFCDDYCRAAYNNELRSILSNQMRDVNKVLSKNRRILEELLPHTQENIKVTQEKLLQKGFLFKYITHLYVTKTGQTCYHCYEYGYQPLDKDLYLITRRKDE